jgi:hypothetical protein
MARLVMNKRIYYVQFSTILNYIMAVSDIKNVGKKPDYPSTRTKSYNRLLIIYVSTLKSFVFVTHTFSFMHLFIFMHSE